MNVIVVPIPADEKEIGDVLVSTPPHWVVAAGEYADQGEPDILVRVIHAVDEEGSDVSEAIAHSIATAIRASDE